MGTMEELSKKEIKEIKRKTFELFEIEINLEPPIFVEEYKEDISLLIQDNFPIALLYEDSVAPTLNYLWKEKIRPKKNYVVVDQGAVKFILNGASVMRPGIKEYNNIKKDNLCIILENQNYTPIAVGIVLMDQEEIEKIEKGKVIKTIHYINDKIWKRKL